MDRIFAFFVGVMCFLHVFSLLVNQSVKIGEKFIDFRNMGDWYLLSVLAFFILGCIGFYFALRSTKNIKKCPSNANFHFITPKSKKRNQKRKIKNLLKVKNVKLKDKSKSWRILN